MFKLFTRYLLYLALTGVYLVCGSVYLAAGIERIVRWSKPEFTLG